MPKIQRAMESGLLLGIRSRNQRPDSNVQDWISDAGLSPQIELASATRLEFTGHPESDTEIGGLNEWLPAVAFQLAWEAIQKIGNLSPHRHDVEGCVAAERANQLAVSCRAAHDAETPA